LKSAYTQHVGLFKALADKNRLMIMHMLTGGELCACKILEKFNITQPTLSHHMKILCDSGLVSGRKEGKWVYYSINAERSEKAILFLQQLTTVTIDETNDRNEGCCE
jgi:ArsR family transcriptional regulator